MPEIRRSILEKIFREMQYIHQRLDDLEKNVSNWNPQPLDIPEAKLIALSDHLRKTYMTVASTGECNAIQVSVLTGRCRALESNYLNQLCRMGWLNKRKVSKTTLFHIANEETKVKMPEFEVDDEQYLGLPRFRRELEGPTLDASEPSRLDRST